MACATAALILVSRQACAQFTDPRNYQNAAVGANELKPNYAYVHADASIDTSLPIEGRVGLSALLSL
jgi:hypothetical protein